MTKDNIGVAVLLEVKKELFASGKDLKWQETVSFRFLFTGALPLSPVQQMAEKVDKQQTDS